MAAIISSLLGGKPPAFPPQTQDVQPGFEHVMNPRPQYKAEWYKGAGKLAGKVAIITGGDSGIGRAVAVLYAREGANVAIVYHKSHQDAQETIEAIEAEGAKGLSIATDICYKQNCFDAVKRTIDTFGRLDIVVNNAAVQFTATDDILEYGEDRIDATFKTNIHPMFYFVQAALPHLKEGSTIINTASVVAYKGNEILMDYASTKGAIVAFTRSLSQSLISKGIRVNGVAPGPIWTPFIPAAFSADKVAIFGQDVPMKRAGQPEECAPAYVFLASQDSSYIAGQMIHVNGGTVVNG